MAGSGTRIPGLPIAAARSHALLAALLIFRLHPAGFTSRDLRELTAQLRGLPAVTAGQMTYDLRRLRSHHPIDKVPGSHRYRVTDAGLLLGRPLPDLGVPRDGDLHRSQPERVVLGAFDLLPLDALPPGFLSDLPDELEPPHIDSLVRD
jgi:hypothetical protein